jgi:hypothetical protein
MKNELIEKAEKLKAQGKGAVSIASSLVSASNVTTITSTNVENAVKVTGVAIVKTEVPDRTIEVI